MPYFLTTASLIGLLATTSVRADFTVDPTVFYHIGEGPGESLDVSHNGKTVMVASPIEIDDDIFKSFVPFINHAPNEPDPFQLLNNLDLGGGEITDVGFVKEGNFQLAAVRDDDAFPENNLYVIKNGQVKQTIAFPDSPDGFKVTPDSRFVVVAVEKDDAIHVYDLRRGPGKVSLAAVIDSDAMESFLDPADPRLVEDFEPESVAISKDSSFALVTITEPAMVAVVNLSEVVEGMKDGNSPEAIGDAALEDMVALPYGFIGAGGISGDPEEDQWGTDPDGICISPDQTLAIAMGEADSDTKHLQSISVLDLTNGLTGITETTYSIFDIDSTLLNHTGLAGAPPVTVAYPPQAEDVPRLDPASCTIFEWDGETIAALVIERYRASDTQELNSPINETKGSILFLDVTQGLNGVFGVIDRVPIGLEDGSQLEAIDTANNGQHLFVSIANGGGTEGTFARLELLDE